MTDRGPRRHTANRADLEAVIAADVRALSAQSEQIGRIFAALNHVGANDFRALMHIMVAETAGAPLSSGELRARLGLSGAGITYLVERMIESGHLRRDCDPTDRRKVILHYADHGMTVARAFFTPLQSHTRATLDQLPDRDLAAAHRVFTALTDAMQAFQSELNT